MSLLHYLLHEVSRLQTVKMSLCNITSRVTVTECAVSPSAPKACALPSTDLIKKMPMQHDQLVNCDFDLWDIWSGSSLHISILCLDAKVTEYMNEVLRIFERAPYLPFCSLHHWYVVVIDEEYTF